MGFHSGTLGLRGVCLHIGPLGPGGLACIGGFWAPGGWLAGNFFGEADADLPKMGYLGGVLAGPPPQTNSKSPQATRFIGKGANEQMAHSIC